MHDIDVSYVLVVEIKKGVLFIEAKTRGICQLDNDKG